MLAYQAEAISFETFYEQLRKRGVTRSGVDADDERAAIQREEKTVAGRATPLTALEPGRASAPKQMPAFVTSN